MDLDKLETETRNTKTMNLDRFSTYEILQVMNEEDQTVPASVREALPQIEEAVETVKQTFVQGGRLIYAGAGTSGRLGVLDAAECVPTFNADPSMVQAVIAGGERAMTESIEGAEDSHEQGKQDLQQILVTEKDTVVGIAASGRTPYVLGALDYAAKTGAATVSLACNKGADISKHASIKIEVSSGPEVLTGSTRLKSGTAQKLVLNMISTASMVGIGKVYQNLMVDMKPSNAKLMARSKSIIMEATGCEVETAANYLDKADDNVKLAIVMILTHLSKDEAKQQLQTNDGFVRHITEK